MRRFHWLIPIFATGLLTGVFVPASQTARAYYNLPLVFWPVDDPHRHVVNYPDADWTWEFLGFNDGYLCPTFYRRERDESYAVWRTPDLPEDQDWLQASQGNALVACYRAHRGTDIATPPLAPVYAIADGEVIETRTRSDERGDDGLIAIRHEREFRETVYTWEGRYIHLDNDFLVRSGPVKAGQVIGYVASRGTNTHLHFEIRDLDPCMEDCILNPWGTNGDYTLLWIDYDDDHRYDVATIGLLPAPADANLVYNGGFARQTEGWSPKGGLDYEVKGGRLWLARVAGGDPASIQQALPYTFEAGTPVTIRLRLGNTSDVTKFVSVSLRALATWQGYVGCAFVLPPHTRFQAVAVRGVIGEGWLNAILAIGVNPPDGLRGVVVDGVSVRVTADEEVEETECEEIG